MFVWVFSHNAASAGAILGNNKRHFPVWNILIRRETMEMPFIFTSYKQI